MRCDRSYYKELPRTKPPGGFNFGSTKSRGVLVKYVINITTKGYKIWLGWDWKGNIIKIGGN